MSRPRILFASILSCTDSSNGASIATMSALKLLSDCSFPCHGFGASKTYFREERPYESLLERDGFECELDRLRRPNSTPVILARKSGVPFSIVRTQSTLLENHRPGEIESILWSYRHVLETFHPDVLWSYRADPLDDLLMIEAGKLGIPVVATIHSLNGSHTGLSRYHDVCTVPSEFMRLYCREALGLPCLVVPNVLDPTRIMARARRPKYVTIVNPSVEKGGLFFARIASRLQELRANIPFLVVEGRGSRDDLRAADYPLDRGRGIRFMAHAADPRKIWALTRLCLMPSLCREAFGLVAAEAMANGIPVIGSNRGAIPEVIGDAGIVLPISKRFGRGGSAIPTDDDVEPWVEAILNIWSDAGLYSELSGKSADRVRRWFPEPLSAIYCDLFADPLASAPRTDFPSLLPSPHDFHPAAKGMGPL